MYAIADYRRLENPEKFRVFSKVAGDGHRFLDVRPSVCPHYCGNAGNAFADYGCGAFKGKQQNGVLLFANDKHWTEVVKISQITDGTSNTLMIGEVGVSQDVGPFKTDDGNFPIWAGGNNDGGCSAWYMGSCLRLADREFRLNRRDGRESNLSFGSGHPGGANVGLADASVQFFADNTDPEVLNQLGSRNGEKPDGESRSRARTAEP